jgi:hypothetical protein
MECGVQEECEVRSAKDCGVRGGECGVRQEWVVYRLIFDLCLSQQKVLNPRLSNFDAH